MKVNTTISISEARKRIFDIAKEVQKPDNVYTLTDNGKPCAVIVSAEEFESMVETIEVQRDFPDLDKDLAELDRDIASGKWKTYTTLEQILQREGYVLADKPKTKYGMASAAQTKSRKGTRKRR